MTVTVHVIAHNSPQYDEMLTVRRRILRAPLGLDFTPEQLAGEKDDVLVAAYSDGVIVGCLVLTAEEGGRVHMRQVAVDAAMQGRGIGSEMVAFSEQVAAEYGYKEIELHARETAVPFYLKLGYEITSGSYVEVTLPHRTMRKIL